MVEVATPQLEPSLETMSHESSVSRLDSFSDVAISRGCPWPDAVKEQLLASFPYSPPRTPTDPPPRRSPCRWTDIRASPASRREPESACRTPALSASAP